MKLFQDEKEKFAIKASYINEKPTDLVGTKKEEKKEEHTGSHH